MQGPLDCDMPGYSDYNCVVLLGPTAVGKTSLAVKLASEFGWDIISADSRQVYKGLDLGSGKDLSEYSFCKVQDGKKITVQIPYHLIDVATLNEEYNVFNFQKQFYALFDTFRSCKKMTFVCGGTGMYVDSVVRGYEFVDVPFNEDLRNSLNEKSLQELDELLLRLKPNLHNKTDLQDRQRTIRAIEIETFMQSEKGRSLVNENRQKRSVNAFVLGLTLPREQLRRNIKERLRERFECGMIDEVRKLHYESSFNWERLEKLGLEYRYISLFLQGKIPGFDELSDSLYHAICRFAKRQETWFRGMERKGVKIHWLNSENGKDYTFSQAVSLIKTNVF